MQNDRDILIQGRTCGEIAKAGRLAVLIDAASYFEVLHEVLLNARRSIRIVGWDFKSNIDLIRGDGAPDGLPKAIGPVITEALNRSPELVVDLLVWDVARIYALEQSVIPTFEEDWTTHERLNVHHDSRLPPGASHHQKIVVVDDRIAFCGGLDLTTERWDTRDHEPEDARRRDGEDEPYPPFHDVHAMVDGDAAQALAAEVRERWRRAGADMLQAKAPPAEDLWPRGAVPDFEDVEVGIATTLPALEAPDEPAVSEIRRLYTRAIASAERLLYLENQYFTSDSVVDALCARMVGHPDLVTILVGPEIPQGWLEEITMGAGRVRFFERLREAGVTDRVRLVHPSVPGPKGPVSVMVHSKTLVVDDRFLSIGSANINNRSMGFDTECNIGLDASGNERHRAAIASVRNRLIGEHLGLAEHEAGAICEAGGILTAFDRARDRAPRTRRTLADIDDRSRYDNASGHALGALADPEEPIDTARLQPSLWHTLKVSADASAAHETDPRLIEAEMSGAWTWARPVGLVLLFFCALAIFMLPEAARPAGELLKMAAALPEANPVAAYLLVPLVFALLTLFALPVTLLVLVCGVLFGPWHGLAIAALGAYAGASLLFAVGRKLDHADTIRLIGPRIGRAAKKLKVRNWVSVAGLRLLPPAPFTFVNVAAGTAGLSFKDFAIGTLLGTAPMLAVFAWSGELLARLWANPQATTLAALGGIAILWTGLLWASQKIAAAYRERAGHAARTPRTVLRSRNR